MSTDLLIYHGQNVLTTQMSGETWWYLYEICDILGFDDYQTVIRWLELIDVELVQTDSPASKDVFIICQRALLDFLASIHTPQARFFRYWVTETAIPELDSYRLKARPKLTQLLEAPTDWLEESTAVKARSLPWPFTAISSRKKGAHNG